MKDRTRNIITMAAFAASAGFFAYTVTGCAGAKKVATLAVVESDRVADDLAMDWRVATHEQVVHCREVLEPDASQETRLECLGPYQPGETEKLVAGVKVLIAAQLAVKVAVECEAFRDCAEDPDWKILAGDVVTAWRAIQPFVQTLKARE